MLQSSLRLTLCRAAQFEQIAPLIKGVVVDSAPAYLSVLSSARAFSSPWLKSNIFVRYAAPLCAWNRFDILQSRWVMLALFATLLSFAKLALLLLTRKSMNHYAQFHLLHSSPVRVGRDCCLPMCAATYTFVQVQKRIPSLFLYSKVPHSLDKLLLSGQSHSSLMRPRRTTI